MTKDRMLRGRKRGSGETAMQWAPRARPIPRPRLCDTKSVHPCHSAVVPCALKQSGGSWPSGKDSHCRGVPLALLAK